MPRCRKTLAGKLTGKNMKQLKFKAYHKKSQQMYDVLGMYQIDEPRPGAWSYDLILPEGDTRAKMDSLIVGVPEAELEILEYIGIKDKFKKNIYSGYIVKCQDLIGQIIYKVDFGAYYVRVAKFDKNEWDFPPEIGNDISISTLAIGDWEIIGNIYQNLELLK